MWDILQINWLDSSKSHFLKNEIDEGREEEGRKGEGRKDRHRDMRRPMWR